MFASPTAKILVHDSKNNQAPSTFLCRVILIVGIAMLVGGCAQVPVYQQAYVSKTGMLFSDSLLATPQPNLISQIEPGSAASGGAQSAGCTACR